MATPLRDETAEEQRRQQEALERIRAEVERARAEREANR